MRNSITRMLALVLSVVMILCSNAGLGDGSVVYAETDMQSVSVETATPGDGRIDASKFKVSLVNESIPYNGEEVNLWLRIKDPSGHYLTEDVDYTASYTNNIYPGTAKIHITYIGRYKGSAEKTFKITQEHIDNLRSTYVDETSLIIEWDYLYATLDRYVVMQYKNGKWQAVRTCISGGNAMDFARLTPNTVYRYYVKGQRKLASGRYVDVAKSSVTAVRTKPYSADYTQIRLSRRTFVYDGTAKKPSFKVIGNITEKGVIVDPNKEYTYSYANNIYPGTATLKVKYTGSSRFKGTSTEKFKIVPAKISGIKSKRTSNSITLTFPVVKGATVYKLYGTDHDLDYPRSEKYKVVGTSKTTTITIKNRKQGSEYRFYLKAYAVKNGKEIMLAKSDEFVERTTPAKVAGVVSGKTEKTGNYTAVRTGTDYVEIGCAPVSGADGYCIYRYDAKSKKWIKILVDEGDNYDRKTRKVYFMVGKLKPGTGYMFRIAAYKSRWTSPDSRGILIGPASKNIVAATVPKTQYKYTYVENAKNPSRIKLYYNVKLGGCSKNKGYFVILNKVTTDSRSTVYKPYKVIKTNKSTVKVDVPMRTSSSDPFYLITVKPYIVYGGKIFVGAENFSNGGNMK